MNDSPSSPEPAQPEKRQGEPSGPGIPSTSRRRLIRWGLPGILAVAVIMGVGYYLHARRFESTDDAFVNGRIIQVAPRVTGHVKTVYPSDNQWVKAGDPLVELDPSDYQAQLDAALAVLAASKATFESRSVGISLTSVGAKADLDRALADVEAAHAMVEAAKAQADAAESKRDQAVAQLALSNAGLEQVKAEVDAAVAKHQRDLKDLNRYREMSRKNTVSQRDLDHASAAEQISAADLAAVQKRVDTNMAMRRQAEAALLAAKDELRYARAQIDVAQARLTESKATLAAARTVPDQVSQSRFMAQVAEADVQRAKAQVAQARLNLAYTHILAPTDGFVTKKAVEPGMLVQAGQALMAVVPRQVWITANFKETQLTRMRAGQPVTIEVDAYPDLTLQGRVDSIQHGTGARFSLLPPENATGNYVKVVQRVPVKIVLDDDPRLAQSLLAPGMSVVPMVDISAPAKTLNAPAASAGETQPSAKR